MMGSQEAAAGRAPEGGLVSYTRYPSSGRVIVASYR